MTTPTPTTTATSKSVDPLKIVSIILPSSNTKPNETSVKTDAAEATESDGRTSSIKSSPSSTSTSNSPGYIPPRTPKSDDALFAEPTFSEKFFRYLVVVIYLGGLSSLGFILSIYYLFFWDSRMPPVFKPTKKPPVFIKP